MTINWVGLRCTVLPFGIASVKKVGNSHVVWAPKLDVAGHPELLTLPVVRNIDQVASRNESDSRHVAKSATLARTMSDTLPMENAKCKGQATLTISDRRVKFQTSDSNRIRV